MALNITWSAYPEANVTGFYDALAYYNTVTGDTFMTVMMLGLYMVFLMVFGRFGMKRSFMVSSFTMFVISGMARAGGLVGDPLLMLFGLCTAIGIILLVES